MPLKKRLQREAEPAGDGGGGSDSEDDSMGFNEADFDDGLGADLMGDAADRERLGAMNMLDRETELFERAEKREELQKQKEIFLQMRAERAAKKGRGRRAQAKGKEGRKAALESLVKRRKKADKKRRKTAQWRDEDDDDDEEMDEDEDEDFEEDDDYNLMDLEEGELGGRARGARGRGRVGGRAARLQEQEALDELEGAVPAAPEEIRQCILLRRKIEEWFTEPYFAECMVGQLVRVSIGKQMNPFTERPENVYRIAEVAQVVERPPGRNYPTPAGDRVLSSPYAFGPKKQPTSSWLQVKVGGSSRTIQMSIVSDSPATDLDVQTMVAMHQSENGEPPMRGFVLRALRLQKEARDFRYTAEEVARKVEAKRAQGRVANVVAEKGRLVNLRDAALERGEDEEASRIQERLDKLEEIQLDRHQSNRVNDNRSLGAINARNADRNFQLLFNKSEKESRTEGGKTTNVFIRRPTAPIIYWNTKDKRAGEALDEGAGPGGVDERAGADEEAAGVREEAEDDGPFEFRVDLSLMRGQAKTEAQTWSQRFSPVPVFDPSQVISLTEYFKQKQVDPS